MAFTQYIIKAVVNALEKFWQPFTIVDVDGVPVSVSDGALDVSVSNNGIVDSNNSTILKLDAGQSFTGDVTEVKDYGIIYVTTKSDQASATDGLSIQQSSDGTNWDHTDEYSVNAGSGKTFSFQAGAQYFRIVYTNGIVDQAFFRLQTLFTKGNGKPSSHRIQDDIVNDDDAELVKSIMSVKTNDGSSYVNVDVQNPMPIDGDSVYCKDIDLGNSDIGNFSGNLCDFFNGLHSENVDTTTDNPKELLIHFNRTVITPLIGVGSSEGGSFSNVKIIGILSGGIETTLSDFTTDNTDRTTQFFSFPNTGLNAIKFQFHTADTISITNIFIPKIRVIASIPETPITYGSSYKSPYMLNGGSDDMTVDGSTTPVDFTYTIVGFSPGRWVRNFIDLQDGTQNFQPEDFGAINGGLTNGIDIIVLKDGVETILENWKTNMDISMTCYDFTSPFKAGAYIGRWTITSDIGSPITLFPDDGLIIRINDNLGALDAFRFRAKLKQ